jgi:hypothetical protein
VSRQLIQHFGDQVFRTVIPRNVRLAEAPSHGLPAILYDRTSRGAVAYMALAGELRMKHNLEHESEPTLHPTLHPNSQPEPKVEPEPESESRSDQDTPPSNGPSNV